MGRTTRSARVPHPHRWKDEVWLEQSTPPQTRNTASRFTNDKPLLSVLMSRPLLQSPVSSPLRTMGQLGEEQANSPVPCKQL